MGFYISFAGNSTYPKTQNLRDVAKEIPLDKVLIETDSPYLSPQPVRGRRNEPPHVTHTISVLAEARGENAQALAARTHENAGAAFSLS
jgi:TatD DNase family protein